MLLQPSVLLTQTLWGRPAYQYTDPSECTTMQTLWRHPAYNNQSIWMLHHAKIKSALICIVALVVSVIPCPLIFESQELKVNFFLSVSHVFI